MDTGPLGTSTRPPLLPMSVAVRWGVVAVVVVAWAWLSFSRNGWVPFLSGVDLGVHEFGHLLFAWSPPLMVSLAGSLVQVAAPAALAGYFWWRRDRLAVVLLVAWLGMSLNSVAVYVHDATRMVLPLFGDDGTGSGHDWRNILADLGWLSHADALAAAVRLLSALSFGAALGLVVWFAWSESQAARRDHEGGPALWDQG